MHTLQNSRLAWHNQNIVYFVLDILWACIMALSVYNLNSDTNTVNTLLVWIITLFFFWHASQLPVKFFSQSYRHSVRLSISVAAVALVYFFVLRADYSIVSLILVSCGWLVGSLWLRFFLIRVRPAQRLLGHHQILSQLDDSSKFIRVKCQSPFEIKLNNFDCVVFDPKFNYSADWQEFFVHVATVGIPVFSISELQELVYGKVPVELLQKSWIDHSFVVNRFYLKLKRFIDLLVVLLCVPILLPISLLVAGLIKLFMGGQVIFNQQRVGLAGEIFIIYKFRTMNIISNASEINETKGNSDPRITKLGRVLRVFRLDELPQFYNVLTGSMSLIGPRPEWLRTANKFADEIPLYQLRHIVRPGITGWAQVQQGHTIGTEGNYQKLRYDLYYIKHCSIWLDCKIIVITIKTLLFGQGV